MKMLAKSLERHNFMQTIISFVYIYKPQVSNSSLQRKVVNSINSNKFVLNYFFFRKQSLLLIFIFMPKVN